MLVAKDLPTDRLEKPGLYIPQGNTNTKIVNGLYVHMYPYVYYAYFIYIIRRPQSAWSGIFVRKIEAWAKLQNPKSKWRRLGVPNKERRLIQNPKSKIQSQNSKIQNPNSGFWFLGGQTGNWALIWMFSNCLTTRRFGTGCSIPPSSMRFSRNGAQLPKNHVYSFFTFCTCNNSSLVADVFLVGG